MTSIMQLASRSLLLGLLLPACVVAKSVGEDPESQGVGNDTAENGESTSTTTTTGASVSASSSQGGTGQSTPDYAECGVTIVPVGPGDPDYIAELLCDGGCTIMIHSSVDTGFDGQQEIGDCLCESIGCGGWTGDTFGSGYDPTDTSGPMTTTSDTGSHSTGTLDCGYDPPPYAGPGEFSARCVCDTCEFVWSDISLEDANLLVDGEGEICECLCTMGDCGGVNGYGEVGGDSSGGDPTDSTTSG